MVEKQEVVGRLPWLLNDTLEADERAGILAELRADATLRAELTETLEALELFGQHPSAEALVDHVFGLPRDDRARIEEHLLACHDCAEHVALVRASRSVEDESVLPFPTARPATPPAIRHAVPAYWRIAAIAASLVAAVGLAGWLGAFGPGATVDPGAPAVGVTASGEIPSSITNASILAVHTLMATDRRYRQAPPRFEVTLQEGFDYVVLELFHGQPDRAPSWTVVVSDADGRAIHEQVVPASGASDDRATFALPLADIGPGAYDIGLFAGAARGEPVARYQFRAVDG